MRPGVEGTDFGFVGGLVGVRGFVVVGFVVGFVGGFVGGFVDGFVDGFVGGFESQT